MKPALTVEQFEAQARTAVDKQKLLIESISQASAALEGKLQKFATSPSTEGLAEAIRNETELVAQKSLSERIKRNYRADDQLHALLNTQAGADVLKAFVEEKRKVVTTIRAKIKPLRQEALAAEEKGDDEAAYSKNEEADNLAATVADFEGHLSTAEQALRRSDAASRYIEIRDGLHLIHQE